MAIHTEADSIDDLRTAGPDATATFEPAGSGFHLPTAGSDNLGVAAAEEIEDEDDEDEVDEDDDLEDDDLEDDEDFDDEDFDDEEDDDDLDAVEDADDEDEDVATQV